MTKAPQSRAVPAEQPLGISHIPRRLRELLGSRIEREVYISTEEAAQLTGRPSRKAFIGWARRAGIPLRRPPGGRVLSVKLSDLEWALSERRKVQDQRVSQPRRSDTAG